MPSDATWSDSSGVLFHFTDQGGWTDIRRSGGVKPLSAAGTAYGATGTLAVWLTDSVKPSDSGRNDDFADVRLTLRPNPSIRYWPMLSPAAEHSGVLDRFGLPASWYLSAQRILLGDILVADVRAADGTWPLVTADFPISDMGPAPTSADIRQWEADLGPKIDAAFNRAFRDGDVDAQRVLTAQALALQQQVDLLDELARNPAAGQRLRCAWRSTSDITAMIKR